MLEKGTPVTRIVVKQKVDPEKANQLFQKIPDVDTRRNQTAAEDGDEFVSHW